MTGLATGLIRLWLDVYGVLPDSIGLLKAPPGVSQTVQPIVTLAVTLLKVMKLQPLHHPGGDVVVFYRVSAAGCLEPAQSVAARL